MISDLPTGAWAAITAAIGAAVGWVTTRGTNRADAAQKITAASISLVNELQEQNASLHREVDDLRAENAKLRGEVRGLKVQVDRLQVSIDRLSPDS